jgi:hypothetical protein
MSTKNQRLATVVAGESSLVSTGVTELLPLSDVFPSFHEGRRSHLESCHADGLRQVNFDGVLAFSLGPHRARILPSSSPPEVPDRAVR